ncbi:alkaline phosphatase [Bacillus sp. AGMB 02131]|uniref:Alkaline phosphatase n=2 Tax=Peribacillus faecalis TaxID=2772559 RepID=A0A927CX87_9BACI|nr:alkaline phosphatase [Peribacillus faecalis]
MIADGFSTSYATCYRWYKGEETLLDSMLVGMHRNYSANSEVTDSAAAATAMATGVKTNNGMISTSPDGKGLKTILEAAKEIGKSTGIVATSAVTHATPACFASHVDNRSNQEDIAPQILENDVDVILGGGSNYFSDSLIEDATDNGYTFVTNRNELLDDSTNTTKLIGLFSEDSMAPELDREETIEPSIAEMSKAAINILKKDDDGFFLMIEGSQIDSAGHDHDAAWAMKDMEAFEEALQIVLDFAKENDDTLVIVTGDHDNGGLSVGGYDQYDANVDLLRNVTASGKFMEAQLDNDRNNISEVVKQYTEIDLIEEEIDKIKTAENPSDAINDVISERALIGWTTRGHTGVDIPVYAFGPKSKLYEGLHENTDLPVLMAKAMEIPFD